MSGGVTVMLPVCSACGAVQQPPRELCWNCLADDIVLRPLPAGGTVLAATTLSIAAAAEYRDDLPVPVAVVQLGADAGGVSMIAFVEPDLAQAGAAVALHNAVDRHGKPVFVALRPGGALPPALSRWVTLDSGAPG